MICLLCNGNGSIVGVCVGVWVCVCVCVWGGQHYNPSIVRGVDFEIKIGQGGGGRRRNHRFTKKKCPVTPSPLSQLINNDWPLKYVKFVSDSPEFTHR